MISIRPGRDNKRFIEITDQEAGSDGQPRISIMIWDSGSGVVSIRAVDNRVGEVFETTLGSDQINKREYP